MYDEIATLYHLVYRDWNAAIAEQAATLDAIIRTHVGPPPRAILDVSCGIGTQALGLAALGHAVTASDLSSAAVERARLEAARRNLTIHFTVADMRRCAEVHGSGFDVVLSVDNSIPHLLSDDAIREALRNFYRCIRPGGITILGLRDHSGKERSSQPANVRQLGYLIYGSPASVAHRTEARRTGLRDLGYVEGKNITIAFHTGGPQPTWTRS